MSDRITWPKPYRARSPEGHVVKADTQSELEEAVDQHALETGVTEPYLVEREGRLEPEPSNAIGDDEEA